MPHPQPIVAIARPFADVWTLDEQRTYLNAQAKSQTQWGDEDKAFKEAQQRLQGAILGHVRWLFEDGRFEMPDHADRVSVKWLPLLDAAMHGRDIESFHGAQDAIQPWWSWMEIMSRIVGIKGGQATDEEVQSAYEEIVELVTTGDFPQASSPAQECAWNGVQVAADTKGWSITLGIKEHNTFTPLESGQYGPPTLHHTTIDLPSGELWINDWFRVEAFTTLTRQATEDCPSLNSVAGCVAHTQVWAEQLGFASVNVGNSMPSVVFEDGRLLVGSLTEEGQSTHKKRTLGKVCTDRWQATMIDKQVLTDLVARSMPRDEAEQKIQEWVSENGANLIRVQLPPGRYHLYHAGESEVFEQTFNMQEVTFEGFHQSHAVLSPTELTPRPTVAPNPKRPRF